MLCVLCVEEEVMLFRPSENKTISVTSGNENVH